MIKHTKNKDNCRENRTVTQKIKKVTYNKEG